MTLHALTSIASDDVIDQAAYWCMRLQADDCTNEDRATFARWLNIDPAHADEYQAMLDIWHTSDHLPRPCAPETIRTYTVGIHSPRRWLQSSIAVAATLLLSLSTLLGWYQGWLPNDIRRYQSAEQTQKITLPDGSKIQLNLASTLWFSNFRDRRSIHLSKGEAFFDIQHDNNHPFVVRANKGSITVTGTQFNVWKDENQVVVTLQEGAVKVHSDIKRTEQIAYLFPGMEARYNTNGTLPTVAPAQIESGAWRDGKLVLDDLTLSQAIPLINRYLDTPVLLADQATRELRIGGIYDIHNINQLVHTLPKVLPVYLTQNSRGQTVISAREQSSSDYLF